jgi:ribosomal protein S13
MSLLLCEHYSTFLSLLNFIGILGGDIINRSLIMQNPEELETRSFKEVFQDHLQLSESGDFENDLRKNYSPDIVLLMENKVYRGYEGIRELAIRLKNELPNGKFQNNIILLDKEIGMLEWTAQSEETEVLDGVDSYLFRDGKIIGQTIHYTVTKRI